MILTATHCGLDFAKRIVPTKPTLLISITDGKMSDSRPDGSLYHAALNLKFRDYTEEEFLREEEEWPAEPTILFNEIILGDRTERLFSRSDAMSVVDFVDEYHWNSDKEYELIVHCRKGVSRSAAVAWFLNLAFDIPRINQHETGRFRPNPRVVRLLHREFEDKYAHDYSRSPLPSLQQLGYAFEPYDIERLYRIYEERKYQMGGSGADNGFSFSDFYGSDSVHWRDSECSGYYADGTTRQTNPKPKPHVEYKQSKKSRRKLQKAKRRRQNR